MVQPVVHKETGFRIGTKNLVLSGLEDQLDKEAARLNGSPFTVKRAGRVIAYSGIPSLLEQSTDASEVYLAQTRDVVGIDLTRVKDSDAKRYFEPFDTVLAITQATFDGGKTAIGVCQVKVYGQYTSDFADG